jgi:hypothetical protein
VATLTEAPNELAAESELEVEVAFCPRLEPFLEIHRQKDNQTYQETNEDARAQARHGGKGGWRNGTHDVEMIRPLSTVSHSLLIALDFILRIGLQCDFARDVPGRRLGEGP